VVWPLAASPAHWLVRSVGFRFSFDSRAEPRRWHGKRKAQRQRSKSPIGLAALRQCFTLRSQPQGV
jgi:hypothetical protein